MIHDTRVRDLNNHSETSGKFVLYWMQQAQRTRYNHALEFAVRRANDLGLPAVVCFGLMDDYPEANARHYAFMLQGLRDVEANLRERGIKFVVRHGPPAAAALHYGRDAALIVCDRGYLRHQKAWRDEVADGAACRVVQVETDVVVPVDVASDKRESGARTIRPKIHRAWETYLVPLPAATPRESSLRLRVSGDIDVRDPAAALARLKLDTSVPPTRHFEGGENAAQRRLREFVDHTIDGYADGRNEPAARRHSYMSMYLHFGQISPLDLALAVRQGKGVPAADRDAYLEELIVRRELTVNYVHRDPKYDAYDGLPVWAKQTLQQHAADTRPIVYTLKQLEAADTHDPYWNASMREMLVTGFMHNYMRMYWGKKILEWTPTPQEAFERTMYLNDKYFLCGRDANGYANVAWVFGLHDRPWGPRRPIFGTVRYMNAAGLERKFDMDAYVAAVGRVEKSE